MSARKVAQELGERFFAGNPCKYGHSGKRYAADGKCVECGAIRGSLRWKQNPEYAKEVLKRWHENNPGRHSENYRKWRESNTEYDKERCLEWQKNNRDKANAGLARRKAALLLRTPKWVSHEEILKVYALAAKITKETGIPHEVDHFYPLLGKTVCGLHIHTNLRVITEVENKKKSNRLVHEGYNPTQQLETA